MMYYSKKELEIMLKVINEAIYNKKYFNVYDKKQSPSIDKIYLCFYLRDLLEKYSNELTVKDIFSFMGFNKKSLSYYVFTSHKEGNFGKAAMNKRYNFLLFTKLALEDTLEQL